jgi:hypothetical protein
MLEVDVLHQEKAGGHVILDRLMLPQREVVVLSGTLFLWVFFVSCQLGNSYGEYQLAIGFFSHVFAGELDLKEMEAAVLSEFEILHSFHPKRDCMATIFGILP